MDQTNTLWVIFFTKKKNLLAKISELKRYGKFKIESWKILYGKKWTGEWTFRMSEPHSRVFSFHDGEILIKTKKRFELLRNHSVWIYFVPIFILGIAWFWSILSSLSQSMKENEKISTSISAQTINALPLVDENSVVGAPMQEERTRVIDSQAHLVLLQAKNLFQYGKLTESFKLLKKNLTHFSIEDEKEAKRLLGEIHFVRCQSWKTQHEERKAVLDCEKAVNMSTHAQAENYLSEQDKKAKMLYLEGYTIQSVDSEKAKQKYIQVLQIARSKSTWRGKAQYQLQKLKKQNA